MVVAAPIPVRLTLLPGGTTPAPDTTGTFAAAPIRIRLRFLLSDDDDTSTPPTSTTVQAPPITVRVYAPVPDIATSGLSLTAPTAAAVVPSSLPPFVVSVVLDGDLAYEQYTVQIQYADNPAFTSPVTLSAAMLPSDGGVIINPATAVPASTYWRARLLSGTTQILGWTNPNTFTVSAAVTPASLPVTWTISASADRPIHLWHLDPPAPEGGQDVTVYGQGFPSAGTLVFDDAPLNTVTTWTRIPATAENTTGSRRINGSDVTCEHYEVVFTAPNYDGPGAALSVEA